MTGRIAPAHTLPAPAAGMHRAQRPTGVVMALVVIALALGAQSIVTAIALVTQSVISAPPGGPRTSDFLALMATRPGFLISLLGFGAGLATLWLWVRAKERRPFATLGLERRPEAGVQILRGLGVGLLMMAACVAVPLGTGQATLSWAAPDAGALLFIGAMFFAFLLQGSTEEILTRGFLTQAVARRFGLIIAIAVQAAVFMLMHGMNPGMGPLPIINLLLFAVFASCYSLADGSLWGICAMHGIWNWAQGNLFGVAVSGQSAADSVFTYTAGPGTTPLLTGGAFGIEGSLVTTAVYLIATALALGTFRRRRAAAAPAAPTHAAPTPAAPGAP